MKIPGIYLLIFIGLNLSCTGTAKKDTDQSKEPRFYGEDESAVFQYRIDSAAAGDTVFLPIGTHYVRTLRLKSGVNIVSRGLLVQLPQEEELDYRADRQHSGRPLFRGDKVSDIHLEFKAETRQEAVHITRSRDITIANTLAIGDSTKVQSFSGLLFYGSKNIRIQNSEIAYYGAPRAHAKRYQPGTGLRFLQSSAILVENSSVHHNGENGMFFHGCADVSVQKNNSSYNGMSGLQVAFGREAVERGYDIGDNKFNYNAADAIDINQPEKSLTVPIRAKIHDNTSDHNGFVSGEKTVDGSGIVTLVGVSDVVLNGNRSSRSNRPAIYLERCDSVYAVANDADNVMELVSLNNHITVENNRLDGIRLLKGVKANKLHIIDCDIRDLSFSNDIAVDSLVLSGNKLKGVININMDGALVFHNNQLTSPAADGAILLTKVQRAEVRGNHISATQAPAIRIGAMAQDVLIEENEIRSVEQLLRDDGGQQVIERANRFKLLK